MSKSDRPSWGRTTAETACVLDCPDSCSLTVTVERGRVTKLDGSERSPVTAGFICAKVRRFHDRVYGADRLQFPMVRQGPKGKGTFTRVSWDEALDLLAERIVRTREEWGGASILPFSYGGSNGLLTQDTVDADLFAELGASRLARTVCAAPTGVAAQAMYGRMAGVAYEDYVHARLIVVWGANPSASGIHLVPFIRDAQRNGARLVVIDPRRTPLAKLADHHLMLTPGTDLPVALALHRHLFEHGGADQAFLTRHATGVAELRAAAEPWTFERAAREAGVSADDLRAVADLYASTWPAVIRCGWGLERNRNGGHAVLAVLGLPAVGGKFGVRGGGYTMSNSRAFKLSASAWRSVRDAETRVINMNRLGRVLTDPPDPPIKLLFVYNCNPVATMPDQARVIAGLSRTDLFTVVFDQVMTDTAAYADLLLPATTFLEAHDLAKGYGAMTLQLVKPVIDAVGETRPNVEVFTDLAQRLQLTLRGDQTDVETLMRVSNALPEEVSTPLLETGLATPIQGSRPVQFVDVVPQTPDGKIHLFPDEVSTNAPAGLYSFQTLATDDRYPLALISPASEKTVSSTLGELRSGFASAYMHHDDAQERGLETDDAIRIFNDLGEVQCRVTVGDAVARGTISLPKGLWRRSTFNGFTSNALVPDSLTDLGDGACFNDARVQVARIVEASFEAAHRLAISVAATREVKVH